MNTDKHVILLQQVHERLRAKGENLDHEEDILRAAAIVAKQNVHLFDLDHSPPTCFVFPALPNETFRVLDTESKKKVSVEDGSWARVLGKDASI